MELSSWSLRQRGYRHRIPDAAPSHTLSGAHPPPIVVIRESGLTITELELICGIVKFVTIWVIDYSRYDIRRHGTRHAPLLSGDAGRYIDGNVILCLHYCHGNPAHPRQPDRHTTGKVTPYAPRDAHFATSASCLWIGRTTFVNNSSTDGRLAFRFFVCLSGYAYCLRVGWRCYDVGIRHGGSRSSPGAASHHRLSVIFRAHHGRGVLRDSLSLTQLMHTVHIAASILRYYSTLLSLAR